MSRREPLKFLKVGWVINTNKNIVLNTIVPMSTAEVISKRLAVIPDINPPKGIKLKVIVYIPITLPRIFSGTLICNTVIPITKNIVLQAPPINKNNNAI